MDAKNFVAPSGNGFVVWVNGEQVGGTFANQGDAEAAYNAARGPTAGGYDPNLRVGSPGGPVGDTGYGGGPYGKDSSQLLADAMASTSREEFEDKIRQFNERLAWEKQSFQANQAMQLLTTAAGLHGQPRDWRKYAEYTQGGQDIFKTIWGSTPAAAFGAPTGFSERATLQDIIDRLSGGGSADGGTGGTGGGALTREQALDAIWANRPDLKAFYEKNGWKVGTPEEQRKAVTNWLGMTGEPEVKAAGGDPIKFATSKGWAAPVATPPPAPTPGGVIPTGRIVPDLPGYVAPPMPTTPPTQVTQQTSPLLGALGLQAPGTYPGQPGYIGPAETVGGRPNPWQGPPLPAELPGTGAGVPAPPGSTSPAPAYGAPLPFQMNPLVWDSLSDTAKQMIIGAVEAGDTPSGVWTATDWLQQFNASRPMGNAPRSVSYNYGAPRSYF